MLYCSNFVTLDYIVFYHCNVSAKYTRSFYSINRIRQKGRRSSGLQSTEAEQFIKTGGQTPSVVVDKEIAGEKRGNGNIKITLIMCGKSRTLPRYIFKWIMI